MMCRWVASLACSALVALGMVLVAGCGGKTPAVSTSSTEATVRGQVIVHGKPVSGGTIWFDPANYRRKNVAAISSDVTQDGTYEITTLIGENSVRYEGSAVSGDRELDGMVQGYTVEEGENTWDLVLPVR